MTLALMADSADTREVAELYRRYAPAVFRRALGLVSDEQEALDVTQETFLAYLKQKNNLRGEAAPFTLLYQIATYQSVDRLRRRARWTGRTRPLPLPEEENGPAEPETGSAGGWTADLSRVEAAQDLALLTKGEDPDVLTAAFLYFVEGHTTQEVGEALELSRKTVGKMLAGFAERARKRHARFTPKGLS